MKNLNFIIACLLVVLVGCTEEPLKEYVTFSGELKNNTDSIITISGRNGTIKTIPINADGTFKDTLKILKPDVYALSTAPGKRAPIFLKNGFDLYLTGDANDFFKNFNYTGIGADNSNFISAQILSSQKIGNPKDILALEESDFKAKLESIKNEYDSIFNSYSNLDSTVVLMTTNQNKEVVAYFENNYNASRKVAKGKPSPKFEGYVDYKGGKKSLDSFKGKYVYIDVWATWCGPCIQQIPYLKDLEKEYHSKNIEFVSISTDESRRSGGSWEAAEKKWRNFVKNKNLTGVQLWSGQDFSFQQAYQITGIPRFILIDPNGNIVDANAPRPSEPRLKELFTSLGI